MELSIAWYCLIDSILPLSRDSPSRLTVKTAPDGEGNFTKKNYTGTPPASAPCTLLQY